MHLPATTSRNEPQTKFSHFCGNFAGSWGKSNSINQEVQAILN